MIQEPVRYDELIQVVSKWSPALKFTLIQELLRSLEPAMATLQSAGYKEPTNTLDQALGLLATDEAAPDDDGVKKILADARMERYG